MEPNKKKPYAKNRRFVPKKVKENVSGKTYANEDCLSRMICKGKHEKLEPNETFLKSAEQLFKDQKIKIVNTPDECRAVISEIRRHLDEYSVLGFDCEWISQYQRYPVALLQLATHRGLCALIRLCKLKRIPEELKHLLADESILKVGIQPYVDARYLIKDYGINCVASTLDLRSLAKDCGHKSLGLGRLAEEHLQVLLNKNRCVCASNWETETLLDLQIEYAAKDAHVSLELFKVFAEKLKPNPIDYNQTQHVQEFIEEYCKKYLNSKMNPDKKDWEDHFENQDIRYVNTVDECLTALKDLKSHCDEYNVIGYKLVKNGSTPLYIQLVSHRRLSLIIRLNKNDDTFPAELKEILENKHILKVGVKPEFHLPTKCRVVSTLDLNYLFCKYKNYEYALSLPALSKKVLNVKLHNQLSLDLRNVRKVLAKNDALISIELFKEFTRRLEPPKTDNDDQHINLPEFIEKHCLNHLDTKFVNATVMATNSCAEANNNKPSVNNHRMAPKKKRENPIKL